MDSKDILIKDDTFSKLFTDCQERFIHFAYTYVGDRMIAEDIFMDSMMYYWEHRNDLDKNTNAQAYILTSIRNKCLNYLRNIQQYEFVSEKIKEQAKWKLSIKIATLEACNPTELLSKEIGDRINRALQKLPEKTRQIFIMCRFEERACKDVALEMNMSVNGVEYHLKKAAESLKKSLKDLQPFLVWLINF
jgi:RNA polymerase sigma-70 factor (ECF subfamily)